MNIFKRASKQKLRFNTNVGNLSVEQLWDLSLADLDSLAVALDEEYEKSGDKSFLEERKSKKDTDLKLRFDITLDILQTKKAEQEKASKAQETKLHNQKILALIERKKEGQMEEMEIEELEALLK